MELDEINGTRWDMETIFRNGHWGFDKNLLVLTYVSSEE